VSQRRTVLLSALVALVAAAGFYMLVLGPKRERATELSAQAATARATLAQTRQQAVELKTAKGSFGKDYTSVVELGKAVPTDDDVRSLMVQIDAAAKRSGVDFRTIQLSGGGGTTTPPAATSGAAANQATTATLPPGATVGTAGFPTMPFSFEFSGKFFTLSDFFARLDRLVRIDGKGIEVSGRLLSVDAFSLKPGAKGFPSVTATVGATAYLLPGANGAVLDAVPATPAAQTASTSAAPSGTTASTAPTTGAIR
jgi:Tfp pilus assembly protein PilO